MIMDIEVSFVGGKRVEARFGPHVVVSDQSVEHGGASSAPEPFELFLASLATCAGLYVLGFCQARHIPTTGLGLVQHNEFNATSHRLERVALEILLPEGFPEQYRAAIVRAAEGCKVKKTLAAAPEILVSARVAPSDALGAALA
ncbi:MAG: OsmC family protein [Pseudomonadota bacterium]